MYIHFNAMRSMGKKAVSLIMMLTLGLTNAWGETETKTEGFQTASTGSYNNPTIRNLNTTESDCNIGWKIYYGNIISNTSAINGKSCLIRWYKNEVSDDFGYARTTTPIKGLTNITFKAKNTSSIIYMNVSYSTDSTKWTMWSDGEFSSNGNDWTPFTNEANRSLTTAPYYFSYDIPNSSPNTDYYIRIKLSKGGTISGNADLIIDDVVFTYTKSEETTIADGETMNIDEPTEMESLTIEAGGTIGGEAELTVKDLTIKSALGSVSGSGDSNGKSCEITNPHITTTGDVFFELELTPAEQASYGWYAFSVPFEVSATDGVYFQDSQLALETGYTIMAYHGDIRAQGQYAWKKHSGVLQPGVLYIISVGDTDYKTLRFKKQAEAALYNDVVNASSQMATQKFPSINPDHAGWNGLGNPYLGKSHISSLDLQFLDHEANAFKLCSSDDIKMMMGSAFFYQSNGSAITITRDDIGSIALAPARALSAMEQKTYVVRLMNEAGEEEDRLFLRAGEDDTDTYEIGRDVAKMSMGDARCAQIWVPAYGTQLCAAAFPLENGQAIYPLTFRAPAAGRYSIAMQVASEADVFLTHEGKIIRNLNESPYEIELAQGTTEGYGLLLQAKMPTGVEEPTSDSSLKGRATKVIIDGHVYILRDGQMYDVTGRMK